MGKQQDVGARLALAQDHATPQMTLYDLASDPSSVVRKAVAARTDAPAQALRPLTRDPDRQVREAVARNPSTSVGNLLRLVDDDDRWVRWAVAGNPACDESVRRAMSAARDKELRGLLAQTRGLEPDLAARLVDDPSPEVRERLATHTHDPDVITALMADRTGRVRKGLARNPRTTAEQRSALAQDPVVDVRVALVRTVELAEADLERLVDDRSVQVRLAMATSAVIPPRIRLALQRDPDDMVAGAARDFRPASGDSPAVRTPRVGQRRSGTGPGRPGEGAR